MFLEFKEVGTHGPITPCPSSRHRTCGPTLPMHHTSGDTHSPHHAAPSMQEETGAAQPLDPATPRRQPQASAPPVQRGQADPGSRISTAPIPAPHTRVPPRFRHHRSPHAGASRVEPIRSPPRRQRPPAPPGPPRRGRQERGTHPPGGAEGSAAGRAVPAFT